MIVVDVLMSSSPYHPLLVVEQRTNPLKLANEPRTAECGHVHIFFLHEDLIVAHIVVQEANHPVTRRAIDQQIGNRHRVLVLQSASAKV
jgi:hypothetical protein